MRLQSCCYRAVSAFAFHGRRIRSGKSISYFSVILRTKPGSGGHAAGRGRNEFARFARFNDPAQRAEGIPDPNAATTFKASKLDWHDLTRPRHQEWLSLYRKLLKLRCEHIVPRCSPGSDVPREANYKVRGDDHGLHRALGVSGPLETLSAHESWSRWPSRESQPSRFAEMIYASEEVTDECAEAGEGTLPPWSVVWFLES